MSSFSIERDKLLLRRCGVPFSVWTVRKAHHEFGVGEYAETFATEYLTVSKEQPIGCLAESTRQRTTNALASVAKHFALQQMPIRYVPWARYCWAAWAYQREAYAMPESEPYDLIKPAANHSILVIPGLLDDPAEQGIPADHIRAGATQLTQHLQAGENLVTAGMVGVENPLPDIYAYRDLYDELGSRWRAVSIQNKAAQPATNAPRRARAK